MSTKDETRSAPILVPVDFSPSSEKALLWAAELAQQLAAPLVVLHVGHDPGEAPGYYLEAQGVGEGESQELRPLKNAASIMLDEFLEQANSVYPGLSELKVESKLVTGVPTSRIIECSESLGVRLIVMGSQGRTGLPRALLGSKAEQVVRLSSIPVTIVKDKIKKQKKKQKKKRKKEQR